LTLESEDPKISRFLKWLKDNGGVFEDSIDLARFEGGLMGIAAKHDIGQYKAFLFIPNTCIISVTRVRNTPGPLQDVIRHNPQLFLKHPDCDQLCLAIFLLHEYLKGPERSYWWPYIDIMNESDLASFWSEDELNRLCDYELKKEAQ
jgi:hypothetical protein